MLRERNKIQDKVIAGCFFYCNDILYSLDVI